VTPEEPALDLDLVAASLRADSTDVSTFVESLATKLEAAVPGRVRVQRRRDGMFGPKKVRTVAVDLGDRRLELLAEGNGVEARCSKLSGGIVLRKETVDTDVWLAMLSEGLATEASRSEATRQALERLLTQ
jgi:hypothetical protein